MQIITLEDKPWAMGNDVLLRGGNTDECLDIGQRKISLLCPRVLGVMTHMESGHVYRGICKEFV